MRKIFFHLTGIALWIIVALILTLIMVEGCVPDDMSVNGAKFMTRLLALASLFVGFIVYLLVISLLVEPSPPVILYDEEPEPQFDHIDVGNTDEADYTNIDIPDHRAMPHVLLHGAPGLGKTALSNVLAKELEEKYDHDVLFIETVPSQLKKKADLDRVMLTVAENPHCVLFIDEIHGLDMTIEESLYKALQDFEYDFTKTKDIDLGEGINLKMSEEDGLQTIELPPFTCVGATTLLGKINKPFKDRFPINIRMEDYNKDEIKQIIEVKMGRAGKPTSFDTYIGQTKGKKILKMHIDGLFFDDPITFTENAKSTIADVAFGVARIGNQYAMNSVAFARSLHNSEVNKTVVEHTLDMFNVDSEGLDDVDREIIQSFIRNKNKPMGAQALAEAVGVTKGDIEEIYTPKLTKAKVMTRGSGSRRVLTEETYLRFGGTL
jgi:Holliday junction DNA helicase RuvB